MQSITQSVFNRVEGRGNCNGFELQFLYFLLPLLNPSEISLAWCFYTISRGKGRENKGLEKLFLTAQEEI